MKYLVILLFAFELLAPAMLDASSSQFQFSGSGELLHSQNNHFDWIGILYIEESGNAERNEKFTGINHACCTETFCALVQFESYKITWVLPNEKNSQPSLFTLHRVLRI